MKLFEFKKIVFFLTCLFFFSMNTGLFANQLTAEFANIKACVEKYPDGSIKKITVKGTKLRITICFRTLRRIKSILKKGTQFLKGKFKKNKNTTSLPTDNTNIFTVSTIPSTSPHEELVLTPNQPILTTGTYGEIDFFFELDSSQYSLIQAGDVLNFELEAEFEDSLGGTFFHTFTIPITVEECIDGSIPTLSQWSLLLLALLMLSLATVALTQSQTQLQTAGASTGSKLRTPLSFPFDKALYLGLWKRALPFLPLIYGLVYWIWDGLTLADLFCIPIALSIVFYIRIVIILNTRKTLAQ